MTLKDIQVQLATASHPVAKALHKGDHFKVLAMGFLKGMILKEHKAHAPTKLFVLEGKVIYRQGNEQTILERYDEIDIPVEVVHAVEAEEDSLCLLTQG